MFNPGLGAINLNLNQMGLKKVARRESGKGKDEGGGGERPSKAGAGLFNRPTLNKVNRPSARR